MFERVSAEPFSQAGSRDQVPSSQRFSACRASNGISPEPFAARVGRQPGEREGRWAQALAGEPEDAIGRGDDTQELDRLDDDTGPMPAPAKAQPPAPNADLARDVAELWSRVERLERLLGLSEDVAADGR